MKRWYHITFYFPYDKYDSKCNYSYEIAEKDSIVHYMVVREVLLPVIRGFAKQLVLWRFHRMYIPEGAATKERPAVNHLKFKFYTERKVFDAIVKQITGNNTFKLLNKLNIINKMEMCKSIDSNSKIASDNDGTAPYPIKESWPYFAQGMSKAWLKLFLVAVKETCKERAIPLLDTYVTKDNIDEVLMFYKWVRFYVSSYWVQNAKFFFHHINVLFGAYKVEVEFDYSNFDLSGLDSIFERGNKIHGQLRF